MVVVFGVLGTVFAGILLPLFHAGLFDVHDPTSLVRFATLMETLRAGQFPAAWTNLLNHGYGYPLFLYYAPLFSYLGVLLKLLTPTYLLALKAELGILVVGAGWGMYRLLRRFLSVEGALIGATAYSLLPYHASTLYVRGSYAEGMTWMILPWLLFVWAEAKGTRDWYAKTSLMTALFLLSHNSLPFLFLPMLALWILIQPGIRVREVLGTAVLTGLLTAWFLGPIFFERNLVQVDMIARTTTYLDHFVTWIQLWHSPWGYGGSAPLSQVDGMSFMLGKFQIILMGLSVTFAWKRQNLRRLLGFGIGTVLVYSYLATPASAWIWQAVPALGIVQFPWRLLIFASFGVAFLAPFWVELLPLPLRRIGVLGVVLALIFFNAKFFVPQTYRPYTDADFISESAMRDIASTKIPEYLPAAMPTFPTKSDSMPRAKTAIATQDVVTQGVSGPLVLDTAYMPQWQLRVNGNLVPIRADNLGRVTTTTIFPSGDYVVLLSWHRTVLEQICLLLSGIGIVGVVGLWIWPKYSKDSSKKHSGVFSR